MGERLKEETTSSLARLVRKQLGVTFEEFEGKTHGIVLRYLVRHSLDPVLEDPLVIFAIKCTYNADHCCRVPRVRLSLLVSRPRLLDCFLCHEVYPGAPVMPQLPFFKACRKVLQDVCLLRRF